MVVQQSLARLIENVQLSLLKNRKYYRGGTTVVVAKMVIYWTQLLTDVLVRNSLFCENGLLKSKIDATHQVLVNEL